MIIQVQLYIIGSQRKCAILKIKKIVNEWIITASGLIDKVNIENKIPVNDIPPVQLSKHLSSMDESVKYNCKNTKNIYFMQDWRKLNMPLMYVSFQQKKIF